MKITPILRLWSLSSLLLLAACATQPNQPPVPAHGEATPATAATEAVVQRPLFSAQPKVVELLERAPQRYVVVKGDTLWEIAGRFLTNPWRWPEVWHKNPQVANPHLIYPGDVLLLSMQSGRPMVSRLGDLACHDTTSDGRCVEKLAPQMRETRIEEAIATIPAGVIAPFLRRPQIMSPGSLDAAPYIISSNDDHLIAGDGNRLYLRNLNSRTTANYAIVRPGAIYTKPNDPKTILGQEAVFIANARIVSFGDPATVVVSAAQSEILIGDKLVPQDEEGALMNFLPRAPEESVTGVILDVLSGGSLIGQFDVVAVDLGRTDGMEPGHVLAVYDSGRIVRDRNRRDEVKLPDERRGLLMIFRVFERISYALVMESTQTLHQYDRIGNP